MDTNEKKDMLEQVKYLQELKRMRDELDQEISSVEEAVKRNFTDEDTIVVGPYKVTYKETSSTRIDSNLLKADNPRIYEMYARTKTYKSLRVY